MTDNENRHGSHERIGEVEFADDGLRVTHETTMEEVEEFLQRRAAKPITLDDTIVWNFSSHPPDYEALEYAINHKLENRRYVIPFQVGGTWAVMYHLLPEALRGAEILVYKASSGQYRAYKNFYNSISPERAKEFRYQLSQTVEEVDRR